MKNDSTQKEILLFTNTHFAERAWSKKDGDNNYMSAQEQMEEACANGLMNEMLPEVFETPGNKKLYLWQMRPAFNFIQIEYGEFPLAIDKTYSINPHNWLTQMNYN